MTQPHYDVCMHTLPCSAVICWSQCLFSSAAVWVSYSDEQMRKGDNSQSQLSTALIYPIRHESTTSLTSELKWTYFSITLEAITQGHTLRHLRWLTAYCSIHNIDFSYNCVLSLMFFLSRSVWETVGVCRCVCFGRIASVARFPCVLRLRITASCR